MNNLIKKLSLLFAALIIGVQAFAQTGTIRGKVVDGSNGEVLMGSTVRLIDGTAVKGGAYTDLEGAYTIKVAPGTYQLLTSYISYVTDTSEIIVTGGNIETVQTLMFPEMAVREDLEVTITAKTSAASEVAFDQRKKSSINSIDGVTFDLVQRTGDANVAAAMQRVVGVTVQDGKYVYVRGLGDRYSQTMLNGASLPSLDPSRNTVQMDIFPSNLIDNVVVYKNFTPDLPGNFTGGLIDVQTKDFPDRFTLNVSASMGYNTNASLRDDFLTDVSSETDWLGYDNGLREIPEIIGESGSFLPDNISNTDFEMAERLDAGVKAFQAPLYPTMSSSFLDQNYQISAGNQFAFGSKVKLGVIGSLSYRNEYDYTDEGGNALFTISGPTDQRLGQQQRYDTRARSSHDVLWGGMGRVSLMVGPSNKVSFNYMHNQSGSSEARYLRGEDDSNTLPIVESRSVNYFERNLDVFQVNGEHKFGPVTIDWIASRAFTIQNQPDQRFISNYVDDSDPEDIGYGFDQSEQLISQRYFRNLNDQSDDLKLNLTYDFELAGRKGMIKVGGAYTTKQREYQQRVFDYGGDQLDEAVANINWDGDPTTLFTSENSGIVGVDSIPQRDPNTGRFIKVASPDYGIILFENEIRASEDQYRGHQDVYAGYAMVDLPLGARLNLIGGVRYEQSQQNLLATARDNQVVNKEYRDLLPSGNLIYKVTSDMNLRAGYSRTLARPAFRELAEIVYIDFLGDFAEEGNPDLTRTLIDNYDLRWEWYNGLGKLISVSAFAKRFQDPIFRVPDTIQQNPVFTYENLDDGLVYGLEFEVKQSFEFISPALKDLYINGNVSLIRSAVNLVQGELSTRRAAFPGLSDTRPMYSQSPYVVNAELMYSEPVSGLTASLSYNIFGPRLIATGGNSSLDAYEQPRGLMNFSVSKRIGERFSLRFRANNLLNPEYISTTTLTPEIMGLEAGAFDDQEYLFSSEGRRGRSFSLSLSYNIR